MRKSDCTVSQGGQRKVTCQKSCGHTGRSKRISFHSWKQRIVKPSSMRQEMLKILYEGKQGIVKCRARARQLVWCLGMSVHISQLVERCSVCAQLRKAWSEPLLLTPIPERPWQCISTDLFFWEKENYLLVVDYFSLYIEVAWLKVSTLITVISALKEVFSRHGIPETVDSSRTFQLSMDLITWQVVVFPQANGEAERAVGTVKVCGKEGEIRKEHSWHIVPHHWGINIHQHSCSWEGNFTLLYPSSWKSLHSDLGWESSDVVKQKETKSSSSTTTAENTGICGVSVFSPMISSDWNRKWTD